MNEDLAIDPSDPSLMSIKLAEAVLCLNCDSIIHYSRAACQCGSNARLVLGRIVLPMTRRQGSEEVPVPGSET